MKRKAVLLFVILGIKTVGYSQDFALKKAQDEIGKNDSIFFFFFYTH